MIIVDNVANACHPLAIFVVFNEPALIKVTRILLIIAYIKDTYVTLYSSLTEVEFEIDKRLAGTLPISKHWQVTDEEV